MKTVAEADVNGPGGMPCRAVLAVWTEKRSVKQVCGELGIGEKAFQLWQERAMEGMLKALQPREGREEERGPALSPRLKRLLERTAAEQEGRLPRLTKRLAVLSGQADATANPG